MKAENTAEFVLYSSATSISMRKIATGIEAYQYRDVRARVRPSDVKPVRAAGCRRAQVRPPRGVDPLDVLRRYI